MSKRDKAYQLFSEGFQPDSVAIQQLGLAESTLERYYKDWLREQEKEIASSPYVPLSSIRPQQLFEYQGSEYRLNYFESNQAHVLLREWAPSKQYQVEQCGRYLPLDILVIPK